jgi:hypothetical protein
MLIAARECHMLHAHASGLQLTDTHTASSMTAGYHSAAACAMLAVPPVTTVTLLAGTVTSYSRSPLCPLRRHTRTCSKHKSAIVSLL